MSARLLDGAAVAAAIRASGDAGGRRRSPRAPAGRPGSASCWSATIPASEIYVRNKVKAGDRRRAVGRSRSGCRRRRRSTICCALVERLNRSDVHDGILVQSPLPDGDGRRTPSSACSTRSIPDKDVDGFHPVNVGRLVQSRAHAGAVHAVGRHRAARAHRASRSPARAPSSSAAATSSASRWRCCCCSATRP